MSRRKTVGSVRARNVAIASGPNMEALAKQALAGRGKAPGPAGPASRAVNRWDEFVGTATPPTPPMLQGRQFGPFSPKPGEAVRQPTPQERDVLGGSWPLRSNGADILPVQDRLDYQEWDETYRSPEVDEALKKAYRTGNDRDLLTFESVPDHTIDPDRPRTRRLGYDPASETLRIRFREQSKYPRGAVYEYFGVPQKTWEELQRQPSIGRFMNDGGLPYPYAYNPDL